MRAAYRRREPISKSKGLLSNPIQVLMAALQEDGQSVICIPTPIEMSESDLAEAVSQTSGFAAKRIQSGTASKAIVVRAAVA
jgi:hypothetical protein